MAKVELKKPVVEEISEKIKDAQAVVLVDHRGLTVAQDTELRKKLREEGVTYKVIEQPKLIKYMVIPHDASKEAVQVVAKGLLNAAEKKDVIIPAGAELRIIQNTEDIRYLILSMSPKSLTQAELKMVAGGDYLKVSSNVVGATNGALIAEGAAAVVEVEVASTTTTFEFEAEVGVGVVAIGVIVLI